MQEENDFPMDDNSLGSSSSDRGPNTEISEQELQLYAEALNTPLSADEIASIEPSGVEETKKVSAVEPSLRTLTEERPTFEKSQLHRLGKYAVDPLSHPSIVGLSEKVAPDISRYTTHDVLDEEGKILLDAEALAHHISPEELFNIEPFQKFVPYDHDIIKCHRDDFIKAKQSWTANSKKQRCMLWVEKDWPLLRAKRSMHGQLSCRPQNATHETAAGT